MSNVLHNDFSEYCIDNAIECRTITETVMSDELLSWHESLEVDFTLVVGWHHLIPGRWLQGQPFYGIHASMLPDLAGGAPLVWAMILGREQTGVTLFQIDEGIDSGPIVGQERFSLDGSPYINEALGRLQASTLRLLRRELPRIRDGQIQLEPQDEGGRVVVPQRSPDDGRILSGWTREATIRFIRAQSRPYPGAFIDAGTQRIRVWAAADADAGRFIPDLQNSIEGPLLSEAGRHYLVCIDGLVELTRIDREEVL